MFSFLPDTPAVAVWAMMIACLLPFIFTGIAKYGAGFTAADNQNPRDFLKNLTGLPARADAVQKNSFETLPMFLASVLTGMLFFVPQHAVNSLAVMYVMIRLGFGIAYLLNLSFFRTILWTLSMACIMMLFWLSTKSIW